MIYNVFGGTLSLTQYSVLVPELEPYVSAHFCVVVLLPVMLAHVLLLCAHSPSPPINNIGL